MQMSQAISQVVAALHSVFFAVCRDGSFKREGHFGDSDKPYFSVRTTDGADDAPADPVQQEAAAADEEEAAAEEEAAMTAASSGD